MSKLPSIKRRLASGFSLAAALFAAFFFLPDAFLPAVLVLIPVLMGLEFFALLSAAGLPNFNVFGSLCIAAVGVAAWYLPAQWELAVMFLCVVGILVRQFPQKNNAKPLETLGGTLLGVFYVGLLWSFLIRLTVFPGEAWQFAGWRHVSWTGRLLLLYAVFAAKFTDIGAYMVGCLFGRHKLFPRLSPNKSWEGVFGGLALGTLAGTLLVYFLPGHFAVASLTWRRAIPVGLFLCSCGVVGDLAESLCKRAATVKDSAGFIPGMGGTLDLLDSLLFTAPATYLTVLALGEFWPLSP